MTIRLINRNWQCRFAGPRCVAGAQPGQFMGEQFGRRLRRWTPWTGCWPRCPSKTRPLRCGYWRFWKRSGSCPRPKPASGDAGSRGGRGSMRL